MDQVDTQLVRFAGPDQPGPGSMPVPPPGQASTGDPPVDQQVGGNTSSDGTSSDDAVFTTVYVGTFIDGVLVTRMAPNLTGETAPVPRFSAAQAYEAVRTGDPVTVASSDGSTRYRVVARLDDRSGDLVVLGLQLDSVDDAIARLLVVEAATTAVVLLVLGLISWWVLRLGVRPIKRMTAAATTIAAGDLTSRIPGATEGTEAAALGSALNAMLERIQASFGEQTRSEQRLRRFVADASHELRTPVTTIRGYAELYRVGALENRQELDTAMRRTEAEAVRMGNLVAEMLQLARLDQGRPTRREPVRLDQVAAEAVADLRAVHPDRPVHADLAPVTVMGDRDQLHQVLANLLTNTVVHTGPGTTVEVVVAADGPVARLTVTDHGPGMDQETVARAFERFYRADPSRSRSSGGTGLGLAIVAAIVGSHHGTVVIDSPLRSGTEGAAGPGTALTVRLDRLAVGAAGVPGDRTTVPPSG